MERTVVRHELAPVFDETSRVLVLGSIPSPKSRELGFYYSHPQNRFWKVLAFLFDEPFPDTPEKKREMALVHHIALWDVLASCEIRGADDASIRSPKPNDLRLILERAPIAAIFTTGTKAHTLYNRYCKAHAGREAVLLPSTSPANCRYHTFDSLCESYRAIAELCREKK